MVGSGSRSKGYGSTTLGIKQHNKALNNESFIILFMYFVQIKLYTPPPAIGNLKRFLSGRLPVDSLSSECIFCVKQTTKLYIPIYIIKKVNHLLVSLRNLYVDSQWIIWTYLLCIFMKYCIKENYTLVQTKCVI